MRKLFCEISPLTYKISVFKCRLQRHVSDVISMQKFAMKKSNDVLPVVVYKHKSLIRRRLGNVDMRLQENKAVNLALASPKINKILIRPQEVFSFWKLVGDTNRQQGYQEGLTISNGRTTQGVGGGMCQMTNCIHWLILHSSMEISEHHHHDGYDLFPDFNRQIPFGTGTSIVYNYLDYRFKNTTDHTYQIILYTNEEYLCGELRCDANQEEKVHIHVEDEYFSEENGLVYRNGRVYRDCVDVRTGLINKHELLRVNHAEVKYDTSHLEIRHSE